MTDNVATSPKVVAGGGIVNKKLRYGGTSKGGSVDPQIKKNG